ncbi:hypothetical protein HJG60_009919 [Phyllostomus discolor]|uniref:Uncharacterized protein n=1 Tax=Phyllostomus discolor TaxID=89673 RepID=A0A834B747_9CHIR|nr:hypothetical protein HJG60_009919 [Phyllostomus discolor]
MAGLGSVFPYFKSSLIKQQPPYHWLSGTRHGTSSSQLRFTAWLHLGISKPSTSNSYFILLYSSFGVTQSRTQVTPGLHHLEKPRACAPSGQLQTTSEHHHPAPAQLTLHEGRGWWSVVTVSPCG